MALHPHPALEHLTVQACADDTGWSQNTQLPLNDVLKQRLPHLQYLSINNMLFNWPLINSLCELHIKYTIEFIENTIDTFPAQCRLPDIIPALARCPLLEKLYMELISSDAASNTALPPVKLPRLASLFIKADGITCDAVLRALQELPGSTQIAIYVFDVYDTSGVPDTSDALDGLDPFDAPDEPDVLDDPGLDVIAAHLGKHTHHLCASSIRVLALSDTFSDSNTVLRDQAPQDHFLDEPQIAGMTGMLYLERQAFVADESTTSLPPSVCTSFWAMATAQDVDVRMVLRIVHTWSLAHAVCLDLRAFTLHTPPKFWPQLLSAVPSIRTVALRVLSQTAQALLESLEYTLREYGARPIVHIILDTSSPNGHFLPPHALTDPLYKYRELERATLTRVLMYCAQAARAGCPLDTIETVDNGGGLLGGTDVDWSEFYRDLKEGFIYDGILHSAAAEPEDVVRNAFENLHLGP